MTNLTILVSPHLDDIALSVGGLLAGNVLARPLLNINLFTRSSHAPYGYRGISPFIPRRFRSTAGLREKLTVMEITRQRRREDLCFFKSQSIPCFDLDLLEAPLRGHRNIMKVTQLTANDDLAFDRISSAISKLTSKIEIGYLLIPLGLGNHIDHRIARDACLIARRKLCPVFYEDLPYAADISLDEINKVVKALDSSLEPSVFQIGEYMKSKIANLKLYPTQIGDHQIYRTMIHAKRLNKHDGYYERLWTYSNFKTDKIQRLD